MENQSTKYNNITEAGVNLPLNIFYSYKLLKIHKNSVCFEGGGYGS